MTAPARMVVLLTVMHRNELRRARSSAVEQLVLMHTYASLLRQCGLPVRSWWGRR